MVSVAADAPVVRVLPVLVCAVDVMTDRSPPIARAVPFVVGFLNDRYLAGPDNPGGYAGGMWFYTLLSSLGLLFAWKLWQAERGPGSHGLETITIKRGAD